MSTWCLRSDASNSGCWLTNSSNFGTSASGVASMIPVRPSAMNLDTASTSSFLKPLSRMAAVTAPIAAPPMTAPSPIGPDSVARMMPAVPPATAPRAPPGSVDLSLVTVSFPPGSLWTSAQSSTTISFFDRASLITSSTVRATISSVKPKKYRRVRLGSAIGTAPREAPPCLAARAAIVRRRRARGNTHAGPSGEPPGEGLQVQRVDVHRLRERRIDGLVVPDPRGLDGSVEHPELVACDQDLDRLPAAPVVGCQAMGADGRSVLARRVAAVAVPPVLRVAHGEPSHHPVPDGLRDHRRARDRVHPGVAVDDRRVRADLLLELRDSQAVDEDVVVAAEPRDRPAHREMRGVVDVEPVDVGDGRRAHPDRD